jgi:hypothetical protein
MIKLLENSFDFGEPAFQILDPRRPLVKSASSEIQDYCKTIKSEAGRTQLLVLAMGSGETYGANRNGDFFPEQELINNHHTFEKYAKWYKHHQNKDPNKSYGNVKKSFYNNAMKRVELLCSIDNAKNPELVKRANLGEDIPVSMSCRVPFDVCSICDHKARTLSEYCGHLKSAMTQIMPDGRQVFAINPNPTFFDISEVFKPADRIAYVLEKVAHLNVKSAAQLALEAGLKDSDFWVPTEKSSEELIRKRAWLKKLSEIEKEIEAVAEKPQPETPREKVISEEAPKALAVTEEMPHSCDVEGGLPELLGGTADRGVMLSPEEFSQEVSGGECPGMRDLLPGIFSHLLESPLLDDALSSRGMSMGSGCGCLPGSKLDSLAANRSFREEPAARRIIKITIIKSAAIKVPTISLRKQAADFYPGDLAAQLAVGYALYKVAALDRGCRPGDELHPLLAVLQNYIVER